VVLPTPSFVRPGGRPVTVVRMTYSSSLVRFVSTPDGSFVRREPTPEQRAVCRQYVDDLGGIGLRRALRSVRVVRPA
jgi:hypothetical protein